MAENPRFDEDIENAAIDLKVAQDAIRNNYLEAPHDLELAYYKIRRQANSTQLNKHDAAALQDIAVRLRKLYDTVRHAAFVGKRFSNTEVRQTDEVLAEMISSLVGINATAHIQPGIKGITR